MKKFNVAEISSKVAKYRRKFKEMYDSIQYILNDYEYKQDGALIEERVVNKKGKEQKVYRCNKCHAGTASKPNYCSKCGASFVDDETGVTRIIK